MSAPTDFLLTRIAEEEQTARLVIAANHGERDYYAAKGMPDYPADAEGDYEFTGPVDGPSGWAAVYIGPARVLAECEANGVKGWRSCRACQRARQAKGRAA